MGLPLNLAGDAKPFRTGLWLGMRLEEIPNDVIRGHASRGIERWVIGNLARNIHRQVVPVVLSSHQAEQLHLRAAATGRGILLYDSADIALRVTKRHSSVKAGTVVGSGPVIKGFVL